MLCLKIAELVANSVDPDETPRSAASHLGLYCLLRPVCPNIYGKYGSSHWKQLAEALLISGHDMFSRRNKKNIYLATPLIPAVCCNKDL